MGTKNPPQSVGVIKPKLYLEPPSRLELETPSLPWKGSTDDSKHKALSLVFLNIYQLFKSALFDTLIVANISLKVNRFMLNCMVFFVLFL